MIYKDGYLIGTIMIKDIKGDIYDVGTTNNLVERGTGEYDDFIKNGINRSQLSKLLIRKYSA
jgi:hypothetical protein